VAKILLPILIITLLSTFTVSAKVAVADNMVTPTTTRVAVPMADSIEVTDVKEKIQYNYYHSDTCGWCQKLDKFLKKHDGYEKLNINKIDVRTRGDEMVKAAEEHGINPGSVGTPFVTYGTNGTWSAIESGYYGALELFADALNVKADVPTQGAKDPKRLYIMLLGLLVIIGPLAYLGLKK
jgi:hypothetical protein